jgi:8-hydroxy-5-deazaflavin:NADPH oxidoreductase
VRIAIVGGTGPFGRALATRFAEAGHAVILGSRDATRAANTAAEIGVRGMRNGDAVGGADVVVLAVDAPAAVATAELLRDRLSAPVLSVASELELVDGAARPLLGTRSIAERVSETIDVPVVAGLHSLAAGKLARAKLDADALLCGDDEQAKELALALAADLVVGRAIDCGPLEISRALEAMTALLVNVNRRYKTRAGLRLTGLS